MKPNIKVYCHNCYFYKHVNSYTLEVYVKQFQWSIETSSTRLWGITPGVWLSANWLGSCHQRPGCQGNRPLSSPVLIRFPLLNAPCLFPSSKGKCSQTSCAYIYVCVCGHECYTPVLHLCVCVCVSNSMLSVTQSGHSLPWWWTAMPICCGGSQQVCQHGAGNTERKSCSLFTLPFPYHPFFYLCSISNFVSIVLLSPPTVFSPSFLFLSPSPQDSNVSSPPRFSDIRIFSFKLFFSFFCLD